MMTATFKKRFIFFVLAFSLSVPFPTSALFDFGGRVLNVPGTHASKIMMTTFPTFPPQGVFTFWDTLGGNCLNGVQEVDQLQAAGVPQPPILLQFIGQYTFSKGPAAHPGQLILGKYAPAPMVCMVNFVSWIYCGTSLCPVVFPLPLFFAPLIIFNGSSI